MLSVGIPSIELWMNLAQFVDPTCGSDGFQKRPLPTRTAITRSARARIARAPRTNARIRSLRPARSRGTGFASGAG